MEVGVEAELYGDVVLKRPGMDSWDGGEFVVIVSVSHKLRILFDKPYPVAIRSLISMIF